MRQRNKLLSRINQQEQIARTLLKKDQKKDFQKKRFFIIFQELAKKKNL